MKKIFLFLSILLSSLMAWGQNYDVNIPVMSPEAASLGRFGAYPVSYYTGTPDISIPLYQLKVNKLTIPITLQYDASGFIPNKDSGKVGHDWNLVAGGVITRSVNLIPDEFQVDLSNPQDYGVHGHWYAIKGLNRKLDETSVRDLKYITTSAANDINFETTPDIFTFNFGKHHGQFVIAHDGTPKVIGDGNYRVDLSNFAIQRMNSFTASSSIIITTDDGTKYTFGGAPESLEISLRMQLENGNIKAETYNGIINAFYLTRIETIDSNAVTLEYKTYISQVNKYVDEDNIVKNCYYADGTSSAYGYSNTLWFNNGISTTPHCTFTKVAYLSAIKSSAGSVTFNYAAKEYPFCTGDTHWRKKTLKLDNIIVRNNNNEVVKGIKLYHSYSVAKDNRSYRMFLTDILSGKEKYSFEYNTRTELPIPETRGIDLRGYYNGNDNNSTLLALNYGSNPDQVNLSHRQPDFTSASKAMLKKITYPTGGTTEFTFENHRYGTRIHRIFESPYPHPWETEKPGMVGGLRIKEIKNVPGETRTFEYETDLSQSGDDISSGVFSDLKTYAILAHFNHIGFGITTWFISEANNVVHANSFSESDIVYSRVTEKCGTGNGKKVYDYSTYLDAPDLPTLGDNTLSYYKSSAVTSEQKHLLWYMLAYSSQHLKRGKLKCLTEYAEGLTQPKRKTTYTYSIKGNADSQAVYAAEVRMLIVSQYGICNSQAFYYYPYQLTREVVEEYRGSQVISRQTDYTYNDRNKLPQEVKVTNSNGTVYRTVYSYPADNPSETPCSDMVSKFVVAPVVYEKHYAGNTLLKTLHNKYALFRNKFHALSSVEETCGNNPPSTLVTFHDYDSRQNVLSFTERGNPTETYLWGYSYQYPIAQLINAPLDSVYKVVPASSWDVLAANKMPANFDDFYLTFLSTALSSAQITAYKYKPLIGITQVREPNKLLHRYEYDALGRLQSVYTDGKKTNDVAYNHTYGATVAALAVSFGDNASSYDMGERTFSMNVSGGSGVYEYKWTIKDSSGSLVASSSAATLTNTFSTPTSYTLECTVTDLVTQERVVKSRGFSINQYKIQFSDVKYTSYPSTGDAVTTAIINCQTPVTVVFRMEYRVGAATPSTHFECRVGSYYYSGSGRGEKTFTLTLPNGWTDVSLNLFNIYAESTVDLYIESVTTAGNQVGGANYVGVYF